MKKINYLAVCMTVAAFALWASGCSNRDRQEPSGQGTTSGSTSGASLEDESSSGSSGTGSSRTGNSESGTSRTGDSESGSSSAGSSEADGAGAGSTGSTEGETGLLDGVMQDVEDRLD